MHQLRPHTVEKGNRQVGEDTSSRPMGVSPSRRSHPKPGTQDSFVTTSLFTRYRAFKFYPTVSHGTEKSRKESHADTTVSTLKVPSE